MQRLCTWLLLGTALFFGCAPREDKQLYIYCSETFWYVMQEEALFFNRKYGFQIVLIPVRAARTSDTTEDAVETDTNRRGFSPWRSIPLAQPPSETPLTQIDADIERQLERIGEERFGDLFLSDSPAHVDKIRNIALSVKEFPVCYLTLSMLVPEGNPYQFHSIKDVLDTNRKLGVMKPSFDGLGEASWKVLCRIVPGGESAIPMELVQLYERQYDLMEALEQGDIDAALVWNATNQVSFLLAKYAEEYNAFYEKALREAERRKDRDRFRLILETMYNELVEENRFAEEVPLTNNPDERYVVSVRLIVLGSAFHFGHCERFADFLRSKRGQQVMRRFGFVPE